MVLRPKLLILDEPTSALDVSTRSRVIELLGQLKAFGAAFFIVAHDLDFVHYLSDRIAVMYLGQIVEMGDSSQIYLEPRHPYTEALLAAKPNSAPVWPDRTHLVERRRAPTVGDAVGLPIPHSLPLRLGTLPNRQAGTPGFERRWKRGLSPPRRWSPARWQVGSPDTSRGNTQAAGRGGRGRDIVPARRWIAAPSGVARQ